MVPPANLSPALRSHFEKLASQVGDEDPYMGDETLGIYDVIRAHYCLAEYFLGLGEGMGGIGARDINLLHSALSRQFSPFGQKNRWSTRFDIVATLFYGLIKNHPFFDANKRTAFLTCVLHLSRMHRQITMSHKKFENFTVDVASNNLEHYPAFVDLKNSGPDPEVRFIALFLKKNSRHVDHVPRAISYRQLRGILNGFGMDFEGPDRNFMDIVRVAARPNLDELQSIGARLMTIVFPGWKDEVKQGELKMIRRRLRISNGDGVDSEDFFNAVDPLERQIYYYRVALERLASR